RNHHLATGQPAQSCLTSLRQACEAAAALAQSQLQHKIMTAANDWRRRSLCEGRRCDQPCHHPSVESGARKQPTSRALGTLGRPLTRGARKACAEKGGGKSRPRRWLAGRACINMNLDADLTITAQFAKDQA